VQIHPVKWVLDFPLHHHKWFEYNLYCRAVVDCIVLDNRTVAREERVLVAAVVVVQSFVV
jgi:hypothetical protein